MFEEISSVFFDEANELLDNLEGYLLTLETEPDNKEIIGAVFRAMHTIKGSSGMFGFDAIQKFTHEMESTFDMVRNGEVPVTKELISLTLEARDHIRSMLQNQNGAEQAEESDKIISALHSYTAQYKTPAAQPVQESTSTKAAAEKTTQNETQQSNTWRIIFRPSPDILKNGTRPERLVKELCEMGMATVVPFSNQIPPLSELDPEKCYLSWDVILTTTKTENDIRDVFIFLDSESKITIEKINVANDAQKKIGEILIDRKQITREELDALINKQKRIGEMLVENNVVSKDEVRSALAEQSHLKKVTELQQGTVPAGAPNALPNGDAATQTIRVNSEKLDQLIDLVGEMVTFNARLAQLAAETQNQHLSSLSELSERLVFALRDNAMDMRMLPIGSIFTRFRRLVHDLASQLDKKIELETEGAETELDKTVIEKLNDPLIHLIRNSCDHGIESPEQRSAAGKPEQGIVKLSAEHAGGFVLITISDDGNGLDRDAIKAKAVERGLIKETDTPSDNEIYEMIFLPGFSTNKTVTAVSGRGVGMDVVRKDIGALGGTVTIETQQGKGSSFILKIPLTLAIIDGMLVKIGEHLFVIPLSNIEACVAYDEAADDGGVCSHITVRGSYLPCINMHAYFELTSPLPKSRQVVIVSDQDSKIGIVVDNIIGNHQTVIKPIGELFKYIQGISGATILGDGSIALIIDILKLSEVVKK
jgi:two-component system chemotaxis sensor kinase CheA